MDENSEYKDKYYAKKNKNLCIYCSYKQAVPSKMNIFCSEICRLLHITISEEMDIVDIAKMIKLSKIDLIQIILNLKSQEFSKKDLCEIFDVKYKKKVVGLETKQLDSPIKLDFN